MRYMTVFRDQVAEESCDSDVRVGLFAFPLVPQDNIRPIEQHIPHRGCFRKVPRLAQVGLHDRRKLCERVLPILTHLHRQSPLVKSFLP
jgi:hypothetical protein